MSALASKTNNSLSLSGVTATDAGTYSVVVSGVCGNAVTNSATLTVNANVAIATPPSNTTNCPGTTASFSVSATGTSLSYQWYKGISGLNGETNHTLTLNNVSGADAGAYSVTVSGVCGEPISANALLVVNENIVVTTPPSDATNCPGTTASFSVGATGTGLVYQWYKGETVLSETNSTLTLNNVSAADAGAYSVVVSGVCGNAVTNNATLTVNENLVIVTAPSSSTNCPGTTASFSVSATGTGLIYQWYKGETMLSETSSNLTLNSVSSADEGSYSVVVIGTCGNAVTNSATLTVNQSTSVGSLANVTKNIGQSVTFTANASGTGPFSYQWYRNGNPLSGETNSTLTLNNLTVNSGGIYSVQVSGACGQAVAASATLVINLPPIANITTPTNNSVFVAPATFTVIAGASDPDGVVTNVEFFASTNGVDFVKIGETNVAAYYVVVTNLTAGSYTFIARATDDLGATGDSAPVNVSVIARPPVAVAGGFTFENDGYVHLKAIVTNLTSAPFAGLRIYIAGVTNPITVANATGVTNGLPYVDNQVPVPPGSISTNDIAFYVPVGKTVPSVTLTVEVIVPPPGGGFSAVGTAQAINRGLFLNNGTFLVEFSSAPNKIYYIQYSGDLVNWKTVVPSIHGNGTKILWIDSGPPATESFPTLNNTRYYRVIVQ
jgi:hypothetical protein